MCVYFRPCLTDDTAAIAWTTKHGALQSLLSREKRLAGSTQRLVTYDVDVDLRREYILSQRFEDTTRTRVSSVRTVVIFAMTTMT